MVQEDAKTSANYFIAKQERLRLATLRSTQRLQEKQLELRRTISNAVKKGMSEELALQYRQVAAGNDLAAIQKTILKLKERIVSVDEKAAGKVYQRKQERVLEGQAGVSKRKTRESISIDSALNSIRNADVGGFLKTDAGLRNQFGDLLQRIRLVKRELRQADSREALIKAEESAARLRATMQSLRASVKEVNGSFNAQRFAASKLKGSLMNLAAGYASIFTVISGARGFYNLGKQFDSMQASLLAASGDAKSAESNMRFLTETARKLGTALDAGVRGFNKIGIAARSQGYSLEETRDAYLAIAEASTAFTLSASEQELSFLAISQMISKGKVQAQELRTQLAEKMPTALTAMVRAWSEVNGLDFTNLEENTNKFYKAMDRGEVLSKQVIPLFSKHLRQLTAESGALDAALKKVTTREGRARGRLQENIKDSFNESAPMFAEGWDQLRDALIKSKPAFTAFSKLLGTLFAGGASLINLLSPVLGTIGNFVNAVANAVQCSS